MEPQQLRKDGLVDVLLVDDKEGEDALLVREWEPFSIRVLHSDDLRDFEVMADGGRPDGWPAPAYDLQAAVIDLDLGHKPPRVAAFPGQVGDSYWHARYQLVFAANLPSIVGPRARRRCDGHPGQHDFACAALSHGLVVLRRARKSRTPADRVDPEHGG